MITSRIITKFKILVTAWETDSVSYAYNPISLYEDGINGNHRISYDGMWDFLINAHRLIFN